MRIQGWFAVILLKKGMVMMTLDGGGTWEFPDVAPFYFAPTDFGLYHQVKQ